MRPVRYRHCWNPQCDAEADWTALVPLCGGCRWMAQRMVLLGLALGIGGTLIWQLLWRFLP